MGDLRKHGKRPYEVVIIHGGPGAAGDVKLLAEELSSTYGVLEPFQTKQTIDGQIKELKEIIDDNSDDKIILIGHSWGAWLGFIFAAKYPEVVSKLILISSGPFENDYVKQIMENRLKRLNKIQRMKVRKLLLEINDDTIENKNNSLMKFGEILSEADTYKKMNGLENDIKINIDIYKSVWNEASKLRENGKLLEYGKDIKCPVIAVHGAYDPHPYLGVKEPLEKVVDDFRIYILEKCGHKPWIEKYASDKFYEILLNEISKGN